jgi:Flp pilus assembly protein TadG
MSRPHCSSRNDRGIVAIEVVLLAPVLVMLVFAIVSLGGFLSVKTRTTGLARDGARAASLGLALPSGTSLVGASCPTPRNPAANVTVQATGTYDLEIPFFPGSGSKTITETVTMRCGG